MGIILLLTVKQERCSDLLLWSAAWLLLLLRLMPMPMPTMATAMALATLVSATPVLDMLVSATPVLVSMVLATTVLLTARGRLRLMPSTDTELTPTPLLMVTLPLPSPLLPSLPPLLPSPPPPLLPQPSLPLLLLLLPPPPSPLPSATPVLDTLVSAMPVLDTTVLLTARGRLRPSLRLMPSTDTELTPTPDTVMLVLATLPPTATATVWEPTELSELTTVKLVQLSRSRSSTQSLLSVLLS